MIYLNKDVFRAWKISPPPINDHEIARRIGVHRVTISRWFNGKSQPTLAQVFALAQAVGVDDWKGLLLDKPVKTNNKYQQYMEKLKEQESTRDTDPDK